MRPYRKNHNLNRPFCGDNLEFISFWKNKNFRLAFGISSFKQLRLSSKELSK